MSKLLHQLQLRIITEGYLDWLRSLAGTILETKRSLQHVEGIVTTRGQRQERDYKRMKIDARSIGKLSRKQVRTRTSLHRQVALPFSHGKGALRV
jgi:hypothetical protein